MRAAGDAALIPFAAALDDVDLTRLRAPPRSTAVAPALTASGMRSAGGDLAAAATAAIPRLAWRPLYEGKGIDRRLGRGLLTAQALGTWGTFRSETVSVGFLSFAPGLHYPLHTHPAGEVYYCLAGRISLQHGREGRAFELEPGQLSVTPPNRVHRLETGAAPALLLYQWLGALDGPTWWWTRQHDGRWTRTAWHRAPGQAWMPRQAEPLTPAMLAEAGEAEG